MNRRLVACVLGAATVVMVTPLLQACGDKFLIGARGTRIYRSTTGLGAAAILIDGRPGSHASAVVINEDPAAVLRREGYTATLVTSANDLHQAVGQRAWDLFIVDAADGQAAPPGGGAAAAPFVLPILLKPTSAALASARRQFPLVMKGPLKTQAFIDAIGDALDERAKSLDRAAKRGASGR